MECIKETLADEDRIDFPMVLSHFQYTWNQKQASPSTDYVSIIKLSQSHVESLVHFKS